MLLFDEHEQEDSDEPEHDLRADGRARCSQLAALSFLVLLFIPVQRFRAVGRGELKPADFKLGESSRVPGWTALPNRNYMNLLELPTLFYPACLMFYVTRKVDITVVAIAWAFVALRVLHSIVHLTYNNVLHRLIVFAMSNFVLAVLWTLFFVNA